MQEIIYVLMGYSLILTITFAVTIIQVFKRVTDHYKNAYIEVGKALKDKEDYKKTIETLHKNIVKQKEETVKVVKENIELKKDIVEVEEGK